MTEREILQLPLKSPSPDAPERYLEFEILARNAITVLLRVQFKDSDRVLEEVITAVPERLLDDSDELVEMILQAMGVGSKD